MGQLGVFLDCDTLCQANGQGPDLSGLTATLNNWQLWPSTQPTQVAQRIKNATVVVSNKVFLNRETLSQAKSLKLICIAATGTNNVDLIAAKDLGIAVCNVVNYGRASVAQHAFSLILALANKTAEYAQAVNQGDWCRSNQFCLLDYPIVELAGKTLGIVGYGDLAKGVCQIAEGFGMKIILAGETKPKDPYPRMVLDQLLVEADVLSIHCPLTANTENLIDTAQLAQMKPSAFIINTARGGIINETALAKALINRTIAGAATDVLSQEPPTPDNPLLNPSIPNLIITPHCAWGSSEARQRLVGIITSNIENFIAKKSFNQV
ncbi:D-2-hydroxyacid dehydrogenase [Pelagibaculum spongiae]|uniref:Glycerate dehydrogenase n=1 Tax=Pelagibaculum spongiae TaxID=2080658 RepID=A0A2V1GW98_9GAMM|nr:D-2-hydroxyacid dehydrogenase [Pelagibaculum spongiae]PVZ70290.1 glycerate dehydrogenase [Pelagibaculum spongiae]